MGHHEEQPAESGCYGEWVLVIVAIIVLVGAAVFYWCVLRPSSDDGIICHDEPPPPPVSLDHDCLAQYQVLNQGLLDLDAALSGRALLWQPGRATSELPPTNEACQALVEEYTVMLDRIATALGGDKSRA